MAGIQGGIDEYGLHIMPLTAVPVFMIYRHACTLYQYVEPLPLMQQRCYALLLRKLIP